MPSSRNLAVSVMLEGHPLHVAAAAAAVAGTWLLLATI
jgi:hypothetical protein